MTPSSPLQPQALDRALAQDPTLQAVIVNGQNDMETATNFYTNTNHIVSQLASVFQPIMEPMKQAAEGAERRLQERHDVLMAPFRGEVSGPTSRFEGAQTGKARETHL